MENFVSFPKLGIEFKVDRVAFEIFGFEIHWYAIIIGIGMLLALFYCFSVMKKFGVNSDRATDVVFVGLIGGILGARAYYIIFDNELTFADFFDIRGGGLAIYGGVIGAFLCAFITAKIRKIRFVPFADVAAIGFAIGQSIGRWGNLINQEAFGGPTNLPWGMTGNIIELSVGDIYSSSYTMVHPCFLYESLWCAIGFVILHFLSKKRKFDGQIFLTYTAWYGLGRFFIEGLRTDSLMFGRLRVSQVLAGLCVIVSVILILSIFQKIKRSGIPAVLYVDTEESKKLIAEEEAKENKEKVKENKKEEIKEKNTEGSEGDQNGEDN
ncbi:MAG: prolipoprotein diacylglyceryl transferase [Oscillospiraceae bacterium]|nr:prolipoprotein diacylglyceryl transferase [Oscillospiraceae bacterium]